MKNIYFAYLFVYNKHFFCYMAYIAEGNRKCEMNIFNINIYRTRSEIKIACIRCSNNANTVNYINTVLLNNFKTQLTLLTLHMPGRLLLVSMASLCELPLLPIFSMLKLTTKEM